MGENLANALQITAVGMGLVFLAIVLLWGLMAALVRITAQREETKDGKSEQELASVQAEVEMDRKKRAALAVVSIALAQQADTMAPHKFPLPATPLVTAWQAVMRTRMHTKRGMSR